METWERRDFFLIGSPAASAPFGTAAPAHELSCIILRVPYYGCREAKLKSLSRNDCAGPKVITEFIR
jgi:hypothetical protein